MAIRAGAITANGGSAQLLDAHNLGAAGGRNATSPDATVRSGLGALAARFAFTDDAI